MKNIFIVNWDYENTYYNNRFRSKSCSAISKYEMTIIMGSDQNHVAQFQNMKRHR